MVLAHDEGARARRARGKGEHVLCHCEQVVPVHALVLSDLVVRADAACVDHHSPLGVGFGVQEVVALGAEVEGGLSVEIWRVRDKSERVLRPERDIRLAILTMRLQQ